MLEGKLCAVDNRAFLMALADNLEQKISAGFIDRQISPLIKYQH
jgi:hypothetical protein